MSRRRCESFGDRVLDATIDRIAYLCAKGVLTYNQAFYAIYDVLAEGRRLPEAEWIELHQRIGWLLDHPRRHGRRYKPDRTVVAARVPSYTLRRIDDFASAFGLTRSQCLGLALDLVYGQDWQLETEPWKRSTYGQAIFRSSSRRSEPGSAEQVRSTRSRNSWV